MFLTFFETRWFVYHSSLELFWQPLKEGCSLETWNRVSQFRHRLKGVVSDVLKRTKLQCHLGQEKQLPSLSLPSPLACGAFGSFLFLGCVPSLVLVDLFLVTVASGEKRRSSDVHLGVGVEQVPFFWHCSELSNCGVATTVCACVWRGDFMEALIWVHTRCTWVYVFHIVSGMDFLNIVNICSWKSVDWTSQTCVLYWYYWYCICRNLLSQCWWNGLSRHCELSSQCWWNGFP